MIRKEESIRALAKELNFDLDEKEVQELLERGEKVVQSINKIRDFDLSKYEHYSLEPTFQTRLRDDETIENDGKEIFENCIDFDGEFVVIKNEK